MKASMSFVDASLHITRPRHFRKLIFNDVQTLYAYHTHVHGFSGMFGSLDCLHWKWGGCPTAWHRQYMRGHSTVILEVVASQDLWFGMPSLALGFKK